MKQLNLEPVNNCINHLIDEKGNHYYIPNYCINDPYFEKTILKEENTALENTLKIIITDLYDNKKIELIVSSNTTGLQLKKLYFEQVTDDIDRYRTRLLFGGSEIKDDHKLYQHNLKDEYQIQLIKNLIE